MEFVNEAREGSLPPTCVPTSSTNKNANVNKQMNVENYNVVTDESNPAAENIAAVSNGKNYYTKGATERDICRYFRQGRCTRGDTCVFSHNIPPDEIAGVNGKQ